MEMRKRIGLTVAVSAVATLALCGGVLLAGVAQAETVLRFAHIHSPKDPTDKGAQEFARLVAKYSEGRLKIKVYPSAQLGNNRKLFGLVRSGGVEMAMTPYPLLADAVPEFNVYTAGYMYEGWGQLRKVLDHPEFGQAWNKRLLAKSGLRVIDNYFFGARTLTTTKTVVKTPADLKGLKIRAVPNQMSLGVVTGLGGTPTPVPFPELFQGLRQGIVDGQENPVATIWAQKFNEVQKYMILTRHQLIPIPWLINEKVWAKLDAKDQAAITKAAREGTDLATKLTLEKELDLIEQLKARGMTVIGPDEGLQLDAFKTSVRAEVLKRFEGKIWPAGLADKVRAIIK